MGNLGTVITDEGRNIAAGLVLGHGSTHKFGYNTDVDKDSPADVWELGNDTHNQGLYTWPASASTLKVSSTEAGDTGGAYNVVIEGLDANWLEYSETVELTGQAVAETSGTFIRAHRMYSSNASTATAGKVYAQTAAAVGGATGIPDDLSKVLCFFENEYQQTLQAIYTVPGNKYGYLTGWWCSVLRTGDRTANCDLFQRIDGGPWRLIEKGVLTSNAHPEWNRHYDPPQQLAPKTDLRVHVDELSHDSMEFAAGFDVVLRTT